MGHCVSPGKNVKMEKMSVAMDKYSHAFTMGLRSPPPRALVITHPGVVLPAGSYGRASLFNQEEGLMVGWAYRKSVHSSRAHGKSGMCMMACAWFPESAGLSGGLPTL